MNGDTTITRAYKKLFDKNPDADAEDWRLAEKILLHWDVPKLGEELGIETLFQIINHTEFPNMKTTERLVGKAENLISEFIPEFSPINTDAHMDYIAFIENKYWEEKRTREEKEAQENKELHKENKII